MTTRDEKADFLAAYIAEFESYKVAGLDEQAESVAKVLRKDFGHEVNPHAPKEQAVPAPELEKAVEAEAPARVRKPRAAG